MRRCETDAVISRVGGAEGEATFRRTSCIDHAVIVIEDFINCYGYAERGVGLEGGDVGVELFGFVVSWKFVSLEHHC